MVAYAVTLASSISFASKYLQAKGTTFFPNVSVKMLLTRQVKRRGKRVKVHTESRYNYELWGYLEPNLF